MNAPTTSARFAPPYQPQYDHTQRSPLPWLVVILTFVVIGIVSQLVTAPGDRYGLAGVAAIVSAVAFSFGSLQVTDEGDALQLRFGPLPLFRKRVRYAHIVVAERDRSSFIDGWGIHWAPGRGWTYNIWGFDCVRLTLEGGRTLRIGSDDADRLAKFLSQRPGPAK